MKGVLANGDLLENSGELEKTKTGATTRAKGMDLSNTVLSKAEYEKIVNRLTNLDNLKPTARKIVVNVKGFGINEKNLDKVIEYLLNSTPEIFYLADIYDYILGDNYRDIETLEFWLRENVNTIKSQKAKINKEISNFDREIKQSINGFSDAEIVLFVHDYLARKVAYDSDGVDSGREDPSVYDIYGVFGNKLAVCQGYSLAAELLLKRYNINCGIASSNRENHAWNVVEVDNKWYHMDITWDDPAYDVPGNVYHDFVLLSDNALYKQEDCANRKDYIAMTIGDAKYKNAVDNKYSNFFWKASESPMHYYNNCWYFMDAKRFQLKTYNFDTRKTATLLTSKNVKSKVEWGDGLGSYWQGNYSKIVGKKNYIYFSTAKDIYRMKIVGNNKYLIKVFTLPKTNKSIFGMSEKNGVINYVASTTPNFSRDLYKNNLVKTTNIKTGLSARIVNVTPEKTNIKLKLTSNSVDNSISKDKVKYRIYYKWHKDKNYKSFVTNKPVATILKLKSKHTYQIKVKPFYNLTKSRIISGETTLAKKYVTK